MIKRIERWLRFNMMYLGSPPWETGISPPELLAFLDSHTPGKALDLGCGTGTNLLTMAKAGWSVVGVDFAVKAARQASRKLQASGLNGRVIQGDVTRVDNLDGPFDFILDIGCFHGLPEASRARYRQNLLGWLAGRGTFLVYVHLMHEPTKHIGVSESDIDAFGQILHLESRQDSLDRFGRKASWLEYQRLH